MSYCTIQVIIYYWLPGGVYTEVPVITSSHPSDAYPNDNGQQNNKTTIIQQQYKQQNSNNKRNGVDAYRYITDPKHREQVIDGNWGIKIINRGDKIEPVQVAYHMTEMDRGDIRNYYGLVGMFTMREAHI